MKFDLAVFGIVPTPKKIENTCKDNVIDYQAINAYIYSYVNQFNVAIDVFNAYFYKLNNVSLCKKCGGIEIYKDEKLNEEEYSIQIENNLITIMVGSAVGCNYALSTLLQLLYCQNGKIYAPTVSIHDYPEVNYRGLMVDLGREFHPFSCLLRYLDLCYFYKINKFHLHLTDGPLYTLPSKSLPKLPNEGASYTKDEISFLVNYAQERCIELIPEIEVPGHCRRLIETYPEIFKLERDDSVKKTDVTCMCRPVAVEAMKRLFDEVIDLFPYSTSIHIGGDEAEIEYWNECKVCKQYMIENHIENEKHLYSHVIKIFTDYLLSKGKKPLVWEGFPKENSDCISRETMVYPFESLYFLPNDLAKAGFSMINCSWEPLYITPYKFYGIKDVLDWNVYTFKNHYCKSAAYLNPIVVEDKEKVKGAQLCVWELTYEKEIERVKAIASAFIERTWTIKRLVETDAFSQNYDNKIKPIIDKLLDERVK